MKIFRTSIKKLSIQLFKRLFLQKEAKENKGGSVVNQTSTFPYQNEIPSKRLTFSESVVNPPYQTIQKFRGFPRYATQWNNITAN